MTIKQVGILGCGQMGSGIAQVCAQAGFEVVVKEVEQKRIDKGFGAIDKNLARAVQKEKISAADKAAIVGRIRGTLALSDLRDCDLVIEAVDENLEIKKTLFSELDKICPEKTIFTSNTSSLPIISIAAVTRRPDRFCGLHFFIPAVVMQLVEVVRTIATSRDTIEACIAFARTIGKTPISAKDSSGFIVNRLLLALLLDAIRAVENGIASIRDIDTGLVLGANHPMGPLALNDFIGLDTMLHIGNIMYNEYREPRYAPPPLLVKMVTAGYLGRKSGKGFYDYSGDEPVPVDLGI